MRATTALLALAALASAACRSAEPPHQPGPLPPLAGADAPGLPPLPLASPRNASYAIDARLYPERHAVLGRLVLEWRNTAGQPLERFPFHLYWNAFRNTLSTAARTEGRRSPQRPGREASSFGWIEVRSIRRLGSSAAGAPRTAGGEDEDLTPTLRYLHQDGNPEDRTVFEVLTRRPVAPGESVRFAVEWEALMPRGDVGRSGWTHDYHFVAQWFPKIGVFWRGAWSAHPFHAWTEFFADYGVYDVRLRLPRAFVVGATGRLVDSRDHDDGSRTLRFVQEDVHDFAWVASPRFLERRARFAEAGYPPVEIRLLLQPEHRALAERYLEATRIALRSFGAWSAPYPYPQITVVDPAWGSASGGMEYPTLFTGGAFLIAPRALHSPEGVTLHEAGHQFWYGLVANNEPEEAWLDEGLTTYMAAKAEQHALGPASWGRRFFGADLGRGAATGVPFVAPRVTVTRAADSRARLRAGGERDVMAGPGWSYRDAASYRLNAYDKPALVLQTLEGLLGEEQMLRVLRTYARRFRFAHPTGADLIAAVEEVTGQDWDWFFDQTLHSSEICDYGIEVEERPAPRAAGWFEDPGGRLALRQPAEDSTEPEGSTGETRSRVTIVRHGEVLMPVELRVELEGGRVVDERWDGRARWRRFEYDGRVRRAVLDPHHRLAIDIDPVNDEWLADEGVASRAATRWSARFLLWVQTFLELNGVLG